MWLASFSAAARVPSAGPPPTGCPSAEETFVVALHQLALDLLHSVERHPDHDQDRGAAEREVLVVPAGEVEEEVREDGHDAEVDRAGQRDSGEDELEVLRRRASGSDAGDE